MDSPTRKQRQRGPEIYFHLEFRVSWPRKESAKSHQFTYRSRGPRERASAFPRQVPAPNTNYLAAIRDFDQRQSRIRELRQAYLDNHPYRHHQMQEYYQSGQHGGFFQMPEIREPEPEPGPERQTRADTAPSHERGRSAPPPIGENPWDVSVPQEQARDPHPTSHDRSLAGIKQKPLPAPPSQFRLGEGGQPWSTWSLPTVGYDPDTHPQDEDDEAESPQARDPAAAAAAAAMTGSGTGLATNPTMVSVFSPEQSTAPAARIRDLETGRARELGALSAAMMTVDNGFENQWWYQGKRESVCANSEPKTPSADAPRRRSTGPMDEYPDVETPRTLPTGVVSPLSDAAFSPVQAPSSLLQRTLSTRSEELWFHERGGS